MDNPQETLGQLAEHARRYTINLDGQVSRSTCAIRGGNAIVYQGTLQPDGTRVAIKTARGGLPGDTDMIKRVLREVHLWSKLRHENVIRVLGITTEFDLTVSIVSHWMEKGNAYVYVQNTDIDPRPLMIDIARGLQYLHTRAEGGPVFHGDLKGPNVLISDSGRALLTDFGFSYLVNSTFSMAASGKAGISINWTAPEIFLDGQEKPSAAADVWSFGMTLLELFTREEPFYRCTCNAIMGKMFRRQIPDRPSSAKTYSRLTDKWWAICLKCWEFEPTSRPTIKRVLEAASQAYNDE